MSTNYPLNTCVISDCRNYYLPYDLRDENVTYSKYYNC